MLTPFAFTFYNPDIQLSKARRAQILDDERKPRFFDCKRRQIGIDVDTLNSQILEAKQRKASEREIDKNFELLDRVVANEFKEQQKNVILSKKLAEKELIDYRRIHQKKELSREYDLNDPHELLKSLPMCIDDNDPRIKSKGSLLRFDGEDYDGVKERKKLGKLRDILSDQIEEAKNVEKNKKVADEEWVQDALMENNFTNRCNQVMEEVRRHEIKELTAYNQLLAKDKKLKEATEKKMNDAEKLAHMYNNLTSDFFLERPNSLPSLLSTTRINANYYKGMSQEKIRAMKSIQINQILERQKAEEDELALEEYFNTLVKDRSGEEHKQMIQEEQQRKDNLKRVQDENKILANEQRLKRQEEHKKLFDNNPTEEFYAQFNKSTK